jgi:predicted RNase H-like HicB family nuclease
MSEPAHEPSFSVGDGEGVAVDCRCGGWSGRAESVLDAQHLYDEHRATVAVYTARYRRSGEWWAIDVPELPGIHSQAERIEDVAAQARDAIGLALDVDPALITVVCAEVRDGFFYEDDEPAADVVSAFEQGDHGETGRTYRTKSGRVLSAAEIGAITAEVTSDEFADQMRDEHFAADNDRIWGAGNWVRCQRCPPDSNGQGVYHHRNAHT